MTLIRHTLVLAFALGPLAAAGQVTDFGPDITSYQRFRVHPHMDKAFEAMKRGDGARAIAELQNAHRLAPQNTAIALHLASAHRRYGQPAQAEAVLRSQLQRKPGDPRLTDALQALRPSIDPVEPAQATAPAAATTVPAAPPVVAASSPGQARIARQRSAPPQTPLAPATPAPKPVAAAPASPGYADARLAYAAVDLGDTAAALAHARRAAQAAPQHLGYQRLLVHLLIENGLEEEAEARVRTLDDMPALRADAAWQSVRQNLTRRMAWKHFDQALQARGRGDLSAALAQAQLGMQSAPDTPAHRLQVLGLLLQSQKYLQAQQVAERGLQRAPGDAALTVLRAAALQAQGQSDEAAQAFDAALADSRLALHEQQNYHLIATDAALAARQPARAQALLKALPPGQEVAAAARQAELDTALRRALSPASLTSTAFRLPSVNCYGSSFTPGCDIWPGASPEDPAREAAQAAYQAYALRDYVQASQKAGQAADLNPGHLPYRLLRLQSLVAGGQPEQAVTEADQYLQVHADEPEVLALRSRLHQQLGHTQAASADARRALQAGGLSLSSEVDLLLQEGRRDEAAKLFSAAVTAPGLRDSADSDLAYLAKRVGDERTALNTFNRAHAAGRLPVTSLQDAAYSATSLAENAQSIDYFRAAIDAADDGRLQLSPRQKFSARREVADRARTWGFNALLGYRGMSPGSMASQPGAYGDAVQAVGEAYWRPQGFRDGSFWEVYGGLAQTLYNRQGGPTGSDSTQSAVGVRIKPLRAHNLILALERRFKMGSLSHNDWLMRAGYSGGFGTDLRVDQAHWNTLNVYAEAGRFLQRRQNYATFEAQAGRSFRMGNASARWVLFPHAVLGVDYHSSRTLAGYNGAAGLGAGLGARYWFREDRYHAPRSYLDLSLQYRVRLAGDERGKGWYLRASLMF